MTRNNTPITHQADLAKLPPALMPLIERPQWCIWRWTQKPDGSWLLNPPSWDRHACFDAVFVLHQLGHDREAAIEVEGRDVLHADTRYSKRLCDGLFGRVADTELDAVQQRLLGLIW